MVRIVFIIVLMALGGCATFDRTIAPPDAKRTVEIFVSNDFPSGATDMPIGVYQVPDSRLYISGQQRGHAAGMAFGLIGLAIVQGTSEARGKQLVGGSEAQLKPELVAATSKMLTEKIKHFGYENKLKVVDSQPRSGAHTLTLIPYVVLTFVTDRMSRPFVIVKASLNDSGGAEIWSSRYISTIKGHRPLDGDDSWGHEGGKPLRETAAQALDIALEVMVLDLVGKLPRSTARNVKLRAQYAFVQQELDLPGKLVESNENRVVFVPQIGDAVVFSGVNIFPKDLVRIADAPPVAK